MIRYLEIASRRPRKADHVVADGVRQSYPRKSTGPGQFYGQLLLRVKTIPGLHEMFPVQKTDKISTHFLCNITRIPKPNHDSRKEGKTTDQVHM